jgi:hypothetical protein
MRTYGYVLSFVLLIAGGALCVIGLVGTQQTPAATNTSLTIMAPTLIIMFEVAGLILIGGGAALIYGVLWRAR